MRTRNAVLRASTGLLCLLAVLCGGLHPAWAAEASVHVTVPAPPPLPNPNAYDYYLKAFAGINGDIAKAQLQPFWWDDANYQNAPLADKQAVLMATRQDLATLRQGFQYPYQHPDVQNPPLNLSSDISKFRDIARYLKFAGEVSAAGNDWNGAMTCDLDTLRLGNDIQRPPNLLFMLVGDAIQAIGRLNCWDAVPHLNNDEAKAAARRLEKILTGRMLLADSRQEEEWERERQFAPMLNSADWRAAMQNFVEQHGHSAADVASFAQALAHMTPQQMMDAYVKNMDMVIAEAKKPYPQAQEMLPLAGPTALLINQTYKARPKLTVNDLENDLLLVTLALQAYHAEHGHYPAELAALVPAELTHIPTDPFTAGQPLHYKLTDQRYLLYSVGPDGIDDGGKAIEHPTAPTTERHTVFYQDEESKGDVVAGVNLN
jgi:hypothetical protein